MLATKINSRSIKKRKYFLVKSLLNKLILKKKYDLKTYKC